ncbi:hypothetical protein HD554DRAFT_2101471 [Boletus coccyginus]|nr:hypothetical protein HD554DRAFT_2101471 [Boletus coccyginus]
MAWITLIKSMVYKEYFSNWMQPWLHSIPLSSSYSEIYNICVFLWVFDVDDGHYEHDGAKNSRLGSSERKGRTWQL